MNTNNEDSNMPETDEGSPLPINEAPTNEQRDSRPEIRTERLWLRPFQLSDAGAMEVLINDREIAANTRTIEYPYPAGAAVTWIESHPKLWLEGKSAVFAISDRTIGKLMGAIGLNIEGEHQIAELGFWVGAPFRNQGYCAEAALAVIEYGLRQLSLKKVYASHLARNPASGRVMEKIGMKREGYFRQHMKKWGVFEDLVFYGMLLEDLQPHNPLGKG